MLADSERHAHFVEQGKQATGLDIEAHTVDVKAGGGLAVDLESHKDEMSKDEYT